MREAKRRSQLAVAARDTTKERSAVREQLRTVRAQLAVQRGDGARVFAITIERPEPNGTERFAGDLGTSIRPGDLVTVASAEGYGRSTEIPASGSGLDLPGMDLIEASWP